MRLSPGSSGLDWAFLLGKALLGLISSVVPELSL